MTNTEQLRTTAYAHGITAVDTDYVRPYLDASHLIVEQGRGAFVDTGTNHSVPLLLAALAQQNLDAADVEFVFLTHVHLDHAGGAGRLMQALPNARAILHPRAARHMIDPAKLVEGAQAVYGKAAFADMYGEIVPIPADRVRIVEDGDRLTLAGREFSCLHTEGHARHHYCLHDAQASGVFTGDSFGVSYRELDTAAGEFIYPTTTPVQFDPLQAHKAIDRIMALAPKQLFLTHYSRVSDLPRLADDMHRGLDDFVDLAIAQASHQQRHVAMCQAMHACLAGQARRHGVELDDDALYAILQMDIELNALGLEHWLEHDRLH